MARGLKFWISEVEGLYYSCSENKGADQLRGTAKLICVSVFAYAKSGLSHDAAQIMLALVLDHHIVRKFRSSRIK